MYLITKCRYFEEKLLAFCSSFVWLVQPSNHCYETFVGGACFKWTRPSLLLMCSSPTRLLKKIRAVLLLQFLFVVFPFKCYFPIGWSMPFKNKKNKKKLFYFFRNLIAQTFTPLFQYCCKSAAQEGL